MDEVLKAIEEGNYSLALKRCIENLRESGAIDIAILSCPMAQILSVGLETRLEIPGNLIECAISERNQFVKKYLTEFSQSTSIQSLQIMRSLRFSLHR